MNNMKNWNNANFQIALPFVQKYLHIYRGFPGTKYTTLHQSQIEIDF